MKSSFLRFVLPLAALAFVAPTSALAQKGKGDGGAGSGPVVIPGGSFAETYVIAQPGSYVLGGNRVMTNASNHIISITAPDVTLDLGGFALSFPGAANATGYGVHIDATENVVVRDGTIANANVGVYSGLGSMLKLHDLRVSGGNNGIISKTRGTLIIRCQTADTAVTGIQTSYRGGMIKDCSVTSAADTGIAAAECLIENVSVAYCGVGVRVGLHSTLANSQVASCSQSGVVAGLNAVVRNNLISGCSKTGISVNGIRVSLIDNVIVDTVMKDGVWRGIFAHYPFLSAGNRMTGNGTNVVGPMVDGGGNTMW